MKKLDLYIKVDEQGWAMDTQAQIVEIKQKINEMMDMLDRVVKYIKEETSNKGSILQFLDDEEVKE
ncbi:unnamed protein product [marine sediment metagenome]|uniref:Uncharacterized protein n=1 Tax=marine sediment metagenome TaxID=412755 RepID=X1LUC7_9ZZZZ